MTGNRPQVPSTLSSTPRQTVAGPHGERGGGGWYVAMITLVLLIALGIYAAYLFQQAEEWRRASEQLRTGQEMLRFDRDEILQKIRDREVTLSTLEAAREQDDRRLEVLEDQRRRLRADVVRLTGELARMGQPSGGLENSSEESATLGRLKRANDRLDRELANVRGDVSRLETALAEKERALLERSESLREREAVLETLRAEKDEIDTAKVSLERQMAERQQDQRRRQIVRGHRASLGEVMPYIAEVGPEDWRVIEGWLAQQLRRPMAVPDLSIYGWSYEGARLIGTSEGPPMAMLLYAEADERPVSLTIARDGSGEKALSIDRDGGLDLLEWREEGHAFFLAGEAGEDLLMDVAVDLQNRPPRLDEDAPVPVSRYIRPGLRPETRP